MSSNLEWSLVIFFRFLWPCIVSKLWTERENQQDATVRCLLSILSQHVSGIIMPIFRRTRRVLLHVVCCAVTTCSNTRLVLLKMGIMMPETCWENIDNKHLTVASCWFSLLLHDVKQIIHDVTWGPTPVFSWWGWGKSWDPSVKHPVWEVRYEQETSEIRTSAPSARPQPPLPI